MEPVAGVLGAALVTFIVPILPYALAFAAGAMIYVVVDDIVPESQVRLLIMGYLTRFCSLSNQYLRPRAMGSLPAGERL